MLPGIEMMACTDLAVPAEVMQHVVRVESSFNPYAIGVVGGRLVRQPRNLSEALSTAHMLEKQGYNFSLGIAQVNRYNLASQGLDYERAFQVCPNLQAGSRILAECHGRANGDWGKALSCYYSGNFSTGFRHGYVQKVFASWQGTAPVPLAGRRTIPSSRPTAILGTLDSLVARRIEEASHARSGVPENPDRDGMHPAEPQLASIPPSGAGPVAAAPVQPSAAAPGQPVLLQPNGIPPVMPADHEAGSGQTQATSVAQRGPEVAVRSQPAERSATEPERDKAFVF